MTNKHRTNKKGELIDEEDDFDWYPSDHVDVIYQNGVPIYLFIYLLIYK